MTAHDAAHEEITNGNHNHKSQPGKKSLHVQRALLSCFLDKTPHNDIPLYVFTFWFHLT
jgi:hypothetical protein